MALLDIVTIGTEDEVLYKNTKRVRKFDKGLHKLLDSMMETLVDSEGAGLAAPQIGIDKRVTVINVPEDPEKEDSKVHIYELINPEIIRSKGSEIGMEGCLSLPGMSAEVDRATYVLVRAQDRHGKEYRLKAYDFVARTIQHEIDHLHGMMMTEKAEQLYRLEPKIKEHEDDDEWIAVPIDNVFVSKSKVPMLNIFNIRKKKADG